NFYLLSHRLVEFLVCDCHRRFGEFLPRILAQELGLRSAQELLCLLIEISEPPLPVEGIETISDTFQNAGGSPVGSLKRFQGSFLLLVKPSIGDGNGSLHRDRF